MTEYEILEHNNSEISKRISGENKEVTKRIGWTTGVQGFLFNLLDLDNSIIPCILTPIAGILISLATIWGVARAFSGRSKYLIWYELNQDSRFPPVIGKPPNKNVFFSPNIFLPLGICFFWIIILWIKANPFIGVVAFIISGFLLVFICDKYKVDDIKHSERNNWIDT